MTMPWSIASRSKSLALCLVPIVAALGIAVNQDGCVHRTGRGAGDPIDSKPRLLEQPIQDTPGEGSMGATTLKGEVNEHGGGPRLGA